MIFLTYLRLSFWLRDALNRLHREERGASSIEGIALVGMVLITLAVVVTYVTGPGRVQIIDALNASVARQLSQWR